MRLLVLSLAFQLARGGMILAPTPAWAGLGTQRRTAVCMQQPGDEPPMDSLSLERAKMKLRAEELAESVRVLGPAEAARSLASRVVGKEAVSSALEALERARMKAGGQTQDDLDAAEATVRGASANSVAMADELPDSLDDSIARVVASLYEAVDSGVTRLVVEFDTSAGDETYAAFVHS